ncbi:hypothetical protein QQ020_13890 [Fulvivirgaceae bacterium BMA12]|uniref:Uncharacterized protein n=1 Tax=Agaribacillus aureus TaxID=3051825 RepID=A0ABT8L5Y6_9BACT|nr:hypothetical protein [Fulvivirgaceae bacterium BMA12]
MAEYNSNLANDFWFDFDNQFLWHPTPETGQDYQMAFRSDGIDGFYNLMIVTRNQGTFPTSFIQYFQDRKIAIDSLAEKQLEVFRNYFDEDLECYRRLFEDFGQGILYDTRRATSQYRNTIIHTMDATSVSPPVGYHRWHGFIRTYCLLNDITDGIWLEINRFMCLAWAIQSIMKPIGTSSDGSNPGNTPMSSDRLQVLKDKFLMYSFADLDDEFENRPYPDFGDSMFA